MQLKPRGPEAIAQQDPNKVVATINGKQITAQQAVNMLKLVPEEQRRSVQSLSTLLERLYMFGQISDEAAKLKLDEQSPWKDQLQLSREQILTQAYLSRKASGADAQAATEAKNYYDAHQGEFDQAKISGILVAFSAPGTPASAASAQRTEAQAQEKAGDLEKKIKAGGDFSALARTDSDNQQSSVKGGDMGTFVMSDPNVPADIKTALGKLQPGQVTEPLRVNGGYYLLKLDSRSKMPFEQARAGIVQKLELEKYKIQIQDSDFFSSGAQGSNIPSLQRPTTTQTAPPVKPPAQ